MEWLKCVQQMSTRTPHTANLHDCCCCCCYRWWSTSMCCRRQACSVHAMRWNTPCSTVWLVVMLWIRCVHRHLSFRCVSCIFFLVHFTLAASYRFTSYTLFGSQPCSPSSFWINLVLSFTHGQRTPARKGIEIRSEKAIKTNVAESGREMGNEMKQIDTSRCHYHAFGVQCIRIHISILFAHDFILFYCFLYLFYHYYTHMIAPTICRETEEGREREREWSGAMERKRGDKLNQMIVVLVYCNKCVYFERVHES